MAGEFSFLTLGSVCIGGMIGAASRYGITIALSSSLLNFSKGTNLVGTLVVNCIGCLLAGILIVSKSKLGLSPNIIAGIGFGILGALTTFSTFSTDTIQLMQNQHYGVALSNVALNLVLCLLLTYFGCLIGQRLVS